jgi:hypothetical protein
LKPWQQKMWCIPPKCDAEFVCAMENVLAVYKRPYDSDRPVVCFDEKSKQLVGEIATPIPAAAGRVECHDYEYVRNGTANLFMLVEPLRGWRNVNVTSRRTKLDFAGQMKELADTHYPKAKKITLVMDNLNTHRMSCLYEAFAPAEARRILEKIEVVHTPKHGSWLNMAETEINIMVRQCLDRRLDSKILIAKEVADWEKQRNVRRAKIHWTFTIASARRKLRKTYPSIED